MGRWVRMKFIYVGICFRAELDDYVILRVVVEHQNGYRFNLKENAKGYQRILPNISYFDTIDN